MALHRLHHRPECVDIRSAYDSDKSWHSDRESELSHPPSQSRGESYASYRTPPTVSAASSTRRTPPQVHRYRRYDSDRDVPRAQVFEDRIPRESPRASSVQSCASTVQSSEEDEEPEARCEIPEHAVPEYSTLPYEPGAIASTPSDFSGLFPSHCRLVIRHDDSTLDGNMNLRIDTEVSTHGGRRGDMTLFHLRMHDLHNREFSLRRYCRDSGREVCHSVCKPRQKASSARPSLQRSLSNALSSMRARSDPKSPTMLSLHRNDSGYGSVPVSSELDDDDRPRSASATPKAPSPHDPNAVKLEFSNYAQLEVKKNGGKGSKRYEFEYWGIHYSWRRALRKEASRKEVSFHLTKSGSEIILAYIIPSPLTHAQAEREQSKGGWVPPCSMWIADEGIVRGQKDVADVVVASGLIVLVDDCIRARFDPKSSRQLLIPKLQMGVEYVGPKRLMNEMFKREESGQHGRRGSRQSSGSRPSSSPKS